MLAVFLGATRPSYFLDKLFPVIFYYGKRCVDNSDSEPGAYYCSFRETRELLALSWLLKQRWIGAQRVQMKGVLPWLVRWTCRTGTRDFCPALAALVGPVENIYFLIIHYFNFFCPHRPASYACRQPCWIACLLVCVSGYTHTPHTHFFRGSQL